MAQSNWTLHWNEKAEQFFAKYRIFPLPEFGSDEPEWGTKRIPKAFRRHQQLDAERWMIGWYSGYLGTGGVNIAKPKVVPATKTLRLLGPRWLDYRHDDDGTALNTYVGFGRVFRNWILTNDRFEHDRIDHLDMEREFSAEVCLGWIRSIRGASNTRLRYAQVAKQLFEDAIAMAWIDADMMNPFDRPIVRRELARLAADAHDESPIIFLTGVQAAELLTTPNSKVHDFRRLRYLCALATGMRDHEIQGLVWSDFHLDAPIPYVYVDRQLVKRGPKPAVHTDDLKKRRVPKREWMKLPSAIVGPPKKKSRRPIPLLPIVVEALRHWRRVGWKQHTGFGPRNDDPVFPTSKSNRFGDAGKFSFSDSPELLRSDLARVGLPTQFTPQGSQERIDFDFHCLRHTFSTLLEAAGVERPMIGVLLGHKAADTAGRHYIGVQVEARAPHIAKIPLPPRVQLRSVLVEAETHAGWHEPKDATVIDLRTRRPR